MQTYLFIATLSLVLFFTACGPGPAETLETEGGGTVSVELPDIVIRSAGCGLRRCQPYAATVASDRVTLTTGGRRTSWEVLPWWEEDVARILSSTNFQAWVSRPGLGEEVAYLSIKTEAGLWEMSVLGDWDTVSREEHEFFKRVELAVGIHPYIFPEEY